MQFIFRKVAPDVVVVDAAAAVVVDVDAVVVAAVGVVEVDAVRIRWN